MLKTKTRKVGNSVAITLPKQLEVEVNMSYIIDQTEDGTIVLVPEIANPFNSGIPYRDSDDSEGWQLVAEESFDGEL